MQSTDGTVSALHSSDSGALRNGTEASRQSSEYGIFSSQLPKLDGSGESSEFELRTSSVQQQQKDEASDERTTGDELARKIEFWRAIFGEQAPEWWVRRTKRAAVVNANSAAEDAGCEDATFSPAAVWCGMVRCLLIVGFYLAINSSVKDADKLDKTTFGSSAFYIGFWVAPVLVANMAAFAPMWFVLPSKFDEAIAEVRTGRTANYMGVLPLDMSDIDSAVLSSVIFVVFYLAFNFVVALLFKKKKDTIFVVIASCFCLPTLGAVIFTLSLDVARARKGVARLAECARDQTLTAAQYRQVSLGVLRISKSWVVTLLLLAVVALYSTVSILAYLGVTDSERDGSSIEFDLLVLGTLGKEASLLYTFTNLARFVNDDADGVLTDVFEWNQPLLVRSGQANAKEDEEDQSSNPVVFDEFSLRFKRLEIIIEGSEISNLTSRDPDDRSNFIRRILSSKPGAICFKVLGIRWTSDYVRTLVASFMASLLGILLKKYGIM